MVQYNIPENQSERPIGPARTPFWIVAGAMTGTLVLHGMVAMALLAHAQPRAGAIDDAAITVFVEPGAPPVATATDSAQLPAPEPQAAAPEPQATAREPPAAGSEPEPQIAAAVTPQPSLQEAIPPPEAMESLAPPDFSQPPPPPPPPPSPPAPRPPRVEPPKPAAPTTQKAEPKRGPPATAPRPATAAPAPAAPAAPAPASPGPSAGGPLAAAPAVASGWNALLAAWLAAHRRYPEEARKRSEEGDVTVRFTVAGDGRVSDVALVKGSGSNALDTSALVMLRGATLPPPGAEVTRTVRIRFRLSD